jgi:hypothetical protein
MAPTLGRPTAWQHEQVAAFKALAAQYL